MHCLNDQYYCIISLAVSWHNLHVVNVVNMVQLSEWEKWQLIGLETIEVDGVGMIWWLMFMSVSPQWANYCEKPESHGYVKDHLGSGCPRVTDARDDAYIINEIPCHSKNHECCKTNSIHTTNASFLSRLSRISSMQLLSRHAWDVLSRAVTEIDPAPAGLEDLLLHLQIKWANIPQRKITGRMRSMNGRVCTCIAAQGAPTHY